MICPYGQCRMANLCKQHCVRKALEDKGWKINADGDLQRIENTPKSDPVNKLTIQPET